MSGEDLRKIFGDVHNRINFKRIRTEVLSSKEEQKRDHMSNKLLSKQASSSSKKQYRDLRDALMATNCHKTWMSKLELESVVEEEKARSRSVSLDHSKSKFAAKIFVPEYDIGLSLTRRDERA